MRSVVSVLLFILMISLSPVPSSLAQWGPRGVQLTDRGTYTSFYICPDNQGGAWFAHDILILPDSVNIYLQHVNADGYRSFDIGGLRLLDEWDETLMGIGPGLNGDCVVIYSRDDGVGYHLYAQRVTQQGEKLWGDVGVPASTFPGTIQSFGGYPPEFKYTVSDGNGGLWVAWVELGFWNPYICGINADGSLKLPDGDILVGEGVNTLPYRLAPDGEGGVVIIYGQNPDWPYTALRHIYAQRILANGERLLPTPRLVMDFEIYPYNGFEDPIYLIYDGYGEFRISTQDYWQRLDSNMNPLWDLGGVPVYSWEPFFQSDDNVSRPVVLSDSSMVQVGNQVGVATPLRIEQVLADGTRRLGTEWGPPAGVDSENLGSPRWNQPIHNDTTFLSMSRYKTETDTFYNIQRLGPSGTSLWSTMLPADTIQNVNSKNPSCFLDDTSLCIAIIDLHIHRTFAYKIDITDGSVAGYSPVDEEPAQPVEHELAKIVQVAPNPFNASTTVTLSLPEEGTFSIALSNVLGQTVYQCAVGERTGTVQGSQSLTLSLDVPAASGVYFLQLRSGNTVADTRKVVLLR